MANLIRRRGGGDLPTRAIGWDPMRLMQDWLGWDPFREMVALGAPERGTFVPSFDVKETKDAYVFTADLPGVKEKDLDVSVTGNRLTVSGKRESEERREGDNYFAYERAYGSFTRSFTLPEGIDSDSARAELKNGVLTLFIPKRPEAQPKHVAIKPSTEKEAKA